MPAEPIEETARAAASKNQPANFAGPKGSASSTTMGIVRTIIKTSPIQNVPQGVCSTRACARETTEGNNSHHAVSMAGKATPMINKMKKMAEMSAMGNPFCLVNYRRYRDGAQKV